jgi:replication factor C subunit 1
MVILENFQPKVIFFNLGSRQTKSKTENINSKACIISGPPGIGKTSTVRLISEMLGYRVFEMNASDHRNRDIICARIGYLKDNTTLGKSLDTKVNEKNLIIMDEVDGMGGNEDRGGISALNEIMKKTKVPIILICNDLHSQKLRTLINNCYDLKFSRPDKRSVVKRLSEICSLEGFNVDNNTLELLVDTVGNDIRQCINYLEMRLKTEANVKGSEIGKYSKDSVLMLNAFDSAKKLLTRNDLSRMSMDERLDLFFIDFDLTPGLIHVNFFNLGKLPNMLWK